MTQYIELEGSKWEVVHEATAPFDMDRKTLVVQRLVDTLDVWVYTPEEN